jgi:hypothetical protein
MEKLCLSRIAFARAQIHSWVSFSSNRPWTRCLLPNSHQVKISHRHILDNTVLSLLKIDKMAFLQFYQSLRSRARKRMTDFMLVVQKTKMAYTNTSNIRLSYPEITKAIDHPCQLSTVSHGVALPFDSYVSIFSTSLCAAGLFISSRSAVHWPQRKKILQYAAGS